MQTAAFQVALQLLCGPTPSRIPCHALLDASIGALQSWVDYDGAFMDHPLYAKWSQRLLAVLHVLWKASWPHRAQKMAGIRLTKVCAFLMRSTYHKQGGTSLAPHHVQGSCQARHDSYEDISGSMGS